MIPKRSPRSSLHPLEPIPPACPEAARRLPDDAPTAGQVETPLVDGPTTEALIAEIQSDGRIWCGPTHWDGATAMRISVSSWKTSLDDALFAANVILDCANRVHFPA